MLRVQLKVLVILRGLLYMMTFFRKNNVSLETLTSFLSYYHAYHAACDHAYPVLVFIPELRLEREDVKRNENRIRMIASGMIGMILRFKVLFY